MRSHRPLPRLAVLAAVLLVAAPIAWACGPFLPNWILGADRFVFDGPTGMLDDELARLDSREPPSFKAVQAADTRTQTTEADLADLERALTGLGTPKARKEEALSRLAALRDQLTGGATAAAPPPTTTVPPGLPGEFSLYLEGAIAWARQQPDEAVRAWEKVLRLPPEQRKLRSTWAAFMLGKARLASDPGRAVESFRQTRELASQGFADSLGLAASSLGWEAKAEMSTGHYDKALVLYQRQKESGDDTALSSLSFAAAAALAAGEAALDPVARDPQARAILTAYVVSRDPEAGAAWLNALEKAGVTDASGADRIAWAAYLAGDFERAAAWLDRAQEPTPIARWVRARLLLRDGKLDEARPLLAGVAHDLPDLGIGLEEAFWIASESEEVLAAPQRAAGEEAAIRVRQKDYTGALDELLRAGFWMDASYLAEQMLSLGELKAYVDADWPAKLAEGYKPPTGDNWEPMLAGGYTTPPPERLARDLRYLLGRRLVREGRFEEALAYLPPARRPALTSLARHLAAGRDGKRPAAERARALFQAACLTRHRGMELSGTEVDPDWTLFDGAYELEWRTGDPETGAANEIFRPTADEEERAKRNTAQPDKRFHYRYRAADLGWEAAKLLPDGEEKAGILATAGGWIANRDPETADTFYKQLVHCCGETALGRAAAEKHWLPEADACPQ